MSIFIAIAVGLVAAWLVLQAFIGLAFPWQILGTLLLKQELRACGVRPDNLPKEFFGECVAWAKNVSIMCSSRVAFSRHAEFVKAIETLARTAALWLRESESTMFKSFGTGKNGYRAIFEKYDMKAIE